MTVGYLCRGQEMRQVQAMPERPACRGRDLQTLPPNHRLVNRSYEKIVIHISKECSSAEQLAGKCGKGGQLPATAFTPKCPSGRHWGGKNGCVKN